MTNGRRRSGLIMACAAAALAGATGAAAASALDLYYERAVMTAADSRCRLFEPPLAAALASAQAQARGAALRAGADNQALDRVHGRALAAAAGAACTGPDLTTAAGRVRTAFEGYSRLRRMTFPGTFAPWTADRAATAKAITWRLSQAAAFGPDRAVLGMAGSGGEATGFLTAASFADGAWPYAARLVFRDVARSPQPQLGGQGGDRAPLNRRVPPRAAARVILAERRALADPLLSPAGAKSAILFRFPASAADLIEGLDPREAVAIEFLFAGQDRDAVRTTYVEVGDFAAGRAFLRVAPQ